MKFLLLLVILLISLPLAYAETREIVLKDGSIISGEVLSFDGNNYSIKSDSLGTITLKNSQIKTIRAPGMEASGGANPLSPSSNNIMAIQQELMSNPQIMQLITALQNDPQVQSLLSDPQTLQLIMSGDTQSLLNNPKFKALMDNPNIQNIVKQSQH